MNVRDFALMYPDWRRMTLEERVARMIAFRAFEPPANAPLATSAALNKTYADEHWLEYLETARAVIGEVQSARRVVG